jgi:hypothetical protein
MIKNCDKPHLQVSGEYCPNMTAKYGITLRRFTTGNAGVGNNCLSMWDDAYF